MMEFADILNLEGYLTNEEAACLYQLAKFSTGPIVEIGTYKGKSALVLTRGSVDGNGHQVMTIDPFLPFVDSTGPAEPVHFGPVDRVDFIKNLHASGLAEHLNIINAPAGVVANIFTAEIGLLFIDGGHEYGIVKHDFSCWIKKVMKNGVIAIHDSQRHGPAKVIEEAEGWKVRQKAGTIAVMEREV